MSQSMLRMSFHDEPGGKTRLELRQGPFEPAIAGEVHDAWFESFGKLPGLLGPESFR